MRDSSLLLSIVRNAIYVQLCDSRLGSESNVESANFTSISCYIYVMCDRLTYIHTFCMTAIQYQVLLDPLRVSVVHKKFVGGLVGQWVINYFNQR